MDIWGKPKNDGKKTKTKNSHFKTEKPNLVVLVSYGYFSGQKNNKHTKIEHYVMSSKQLFFHKKRLWIQAICDPLIILFYVYVHPNFMYWS